MLFNFLLTFVLDRVEKDDKEKGATAVEYGLLVALIAAVIVGLVRVLGGQIAKAFTDVINALR